MSAPPNGERRPWQDGARTPAKKSRPSVERSQVPCIDAADQLYAATTHPAGHEPSAWMRDRLARVTRHARSLGLDPDAASPVIVAPLGDRMATPGTDEDRRCDRCRVVVPHGGALYLLRMHPRRSLVVVGGLCAADAALEFGREVPV